MPGCLRKAVRKGIPPWRQKASIRKKPPLVKQGAPDQQTPVCTAYGPLVPCKQAESCGWHGLGKEGGTAERKSLHSKAFRCTSNKTPEVTGICAELSMARKVSTGIDTFSELREYNIFYIDKTHFIKDWWEQNDNVTLITRPRRFGKTLMLDTVRTFFSTEYRDRLDLFDGLFISSDKNLCSIQGKIPVIFLSFSDIKSTTFSEMKDEIKLSLSAIYNNIEYILD